MLQSSLLAPFCTNEKASIRLRIDAFYNRKIKLFALYPTRVDKTLSISTH